MSSDQWYSLGYMTKNILMLWRKDVEGKLYLTHLFQQKSVLCAQCHGRQKAACWLWGNVCCGQWGWVSINIMIIIELASEAHIKFSCFVIIQPQAGNSLVTDLLQQTISTQNIHSGLKGKCGKHQTQKKQINRRVFLFNQNSELLLPSVYKFSWEYSMVIHFQQQVKVIEHFFLQI